MINSILQTPSPLVTPLVTCISYIYTTNRYYVQGNLTLYGLPTEPTYLTCKEKYVIHRKGKHTRVTHAVVKVTLV